MNTLIEMQNLPDYSTKTDLIEATDVDISNLPAKADLASLKTQIDKLNVNKLRTVSLLKKISYLM